FLLKIYCKIDQRDLNHRRFLALHRFNNTAPDYGLISKLPECVDRRQTNVHVGVVHQRVEERGQNFTPWLLQLIAPVHTSEAIRGGVLLHQRQSHHLAHLRELASEFRDFVIRWRGRRRCCREVLPANEGAEKQQREGHTKLQCRLAWPPTAEP